MEISRLIFSKETKEKMNGNLSTHGKREVLWNRLKEISDNGKLDMCKSRKEVGRMVGYPAEREQAGYLWVTSMIHQGKLKETVMGIDKRGYMEYEYKLVENPIRSADLRDDWGNAKAKGKMRFDKLKELAASGKLAKARTRRDIVKLVGYPEEERKAGYSWVSGMIYQGHIKESNLRVGKDGTFEAEYTLTGTEPSYVYGRKKVTTNNKETKEMSKKRLSKREKGQIKWDKLVEATNGGYLALCKTRKDVARLAGYTDSDMHSGYSWIMNMLSRKHIFEKKIGVDDRGMAQYEYRLGTAPNYNLTGTKHKKPEPQIIERARMISEVPSEVTIAAPNAKVVITYGELKIELNEVSPNMVKEIISSMFDKVKGE